MAKKTERSAYIQWLRLLAAAGVVLLHTAGSQWYTPAWDSVEWAVLNGYDGLVRWCVLVFLMVTGAVFLPKEPTLGTMLRRYLPRMVVCWVIWSGIYALWGRYCGNDWEQVRTALLQGHYHLWYLPFLWGVYLVLPFLSTIAKDEKLELQLLGVGLAVGMWLPWLAQFVQLLRPDWETPLAIVKNHIHYTFFCDLLAVPLLGHVLSKRDFSAGQRRLIYLLGLACLLLTGPLNHWATAIAGVRSSLFFELNAPNNLCTAAAIFLFARYHLTTLPRIVDHAARASFGIYLVHVLILEVLAKYGVDPLTADPLWTTPALTAAVFCLSWAAAAVLQKIPLVGKYLA